MNTEKCRSCGANVVWVQTQKGKAMPVNAETFTEGDMMYIPGKHISHFATCPQSEKWRKKT